MATFRERKRTGRKNGRFQSTGVKSRMENFLDSRKDSRVIALLMLKCHFSPRVKVKPRYRGGVLSNSVCFLRSLLMVAIIVEVLCSCRTVAKNFYLDLEAFSLFSCIEDNCGEINDCVTPAKFTE